jgi:hypothetical protein
MRPFTDRGRRVFGVSRGGGDVAQGGLFDQVKMAQQGDVGPFGVPGSEGGEQFVVSGEVVAVPLMRWDDRRGGPTRR